MQVLVFTLGSTPFALEVEGVESIHAATADDLCLSKFLGLAAPSGGRSVALRGGGEGRLRLGADLRLAELSPTQFEPLPAIFGASRGIAGVVLDLVDARVGFLLDAAALPRG